MTPRETLVKYGLKTDAKSVKERIIGDAKYGHYECAKQYSIRNKIYVFDYIIQECKQADLDLLCELAEKVEKIQEFCDERFHPIDAMYQIKLILDGEK